MIVFKTLLNLILFPAAGLFRIMTGIRNWLYDRQILKSHSVNAPVISVGNIAVGGTGKTPFVIALTKQLTKAGYSPGVVTRGYRRQSRGRQLVRDRSSVLSNAAQAGDEAFMIASSVHGSVVIADADRVAAARAAVERYACDIIIADDAFQHRRLQRDVDIVLWDADDDPAHSAILPLGRLRESIKNLRRANLLLVTRRNSVSTSAVKIFKQMNPDLFIAPLPMTISGIHQFGNDVEISWSELNGKQVLAFCGLGNPRQFFSTVESLTTVQPVSKSFPDHHKYSGKDVDELIKKAAQKNCEYLITTRKDTVNLPDSAATVGKLLVVDILYELSEKIKAAILQKLPPRL